MSTKGRSRTTYIVKTINKALQDHVESKHLVAVSSKYNTNGNVIICTREDQTAVELAKYSHLFTELIASGRDEMSYAGQIDDGTRYKSTTLTQLAKLTVVSGPWVGSIWMFRSYFLVALSHP
ncbi:uncharacterized protein EV420DRAFT_1483734 [Desarmillaria tabescens]|uniref:Uncharacterized protein n=1 Tax=Armillaria tabescens TaxID=1929756 RepID=A0AA39JRV8_ARMTA|nr:uncharacterized protein EV420DRAFT_1483734 [Desarmillaria tabescens]KAK0447357.1 hypothetical protein EV420DRAFT_1483734 [Desarmillaria tabescens]